MRPDKTILAAAAATLALYRAGRAAQEIPVWRMLATPLEALRRRAEAVVAALPDGAAAVVEVGATVGGGSVPGATVPSIGVALAGSTARSATSLLGSLRTEDPCVIGRIERDRVVLDLRAIAPEDDEMLVGAVARALAAQPAR
jgi:L-seryl-tRNA(Ser) seleniumtransferase